MLADTLTGSIAYVKTNAGLPDGSKYQSSAGIGGSGSPDTITVRHDIPAILNNGKGTRRTLISLSSPLRDFESAPMAERVTVNLTITHPNVAHDGTQVTAKLLDLLVAISNASAADTFLTNVADGMY